MKPVTGRNNSFQKVIDTLEENYKEPIIIVETGSIRDSDEDAKKLGDGWSTINWEYYAKKTNSKVHVVDIDEYNINQGKKVVPQSRWVEYFQDDSVNFLRNFDKKIDLLYLDSYDYYGVEEEIKKCHNHQLNEIKAAFDKLNDKCFVLIDDVFSDENLDGKGKLSIPYLLENGFEKVHFIDYQYFLKRE